MAVPMNDPPGYTYVGSGQATSGNIVIGNTIERDPQVMSEVARLNDVASQLEKVANELRDKLTPICRPSVPAPPIDKTTVNAVPTPCAPLAGTLDDLGTRLFQAVKDLESILQRAEV